ncbi:hypothetical protein BH24DEI2_BH24DEI2_26600 [soil metagenome]
MKISFLSIQTARGAKDSAMRSKCFFLRLLKTNFLLKKLFKIFALDMN